MSALDDALALIAARPWQAKSKVKRTGVAAILVENELVVPAIVDVEGAVRELLAAIASDPIAVWAALRLLAVRYAALPAIEDIARSLGVAIDERLDDPWQLVPLRVAGAPLRNVAVDVRLRDGRVLTRDQSRGFVELFAFGRACWPHPAHAILRDALDDAERARLAASLPRRKRPWNRAYGRLAGLGAPRKDEDDIEWETRAFADETGMYRMAKGRRRGAARAARAWLDLVYAPAIVPELDRSVVAAAYRHALEDAMIAGRRWPISIVARMRERPLLGAMIDQLVWTCGDTAFRFDAGRAVDVGGKPIDIIGPIGVAHPLTLEAATRAAFSSSLPDQPFQQLARGIYALADAPPSKRVRMRTWRMLSLLDRGWTLDRQGSRSFDRKYIRGMSNRCARISVELESDASRLAMHDEVEVDTLIAGSDPIAISEGVRALRWCMVATGAPDVAPADRALEGALAAEDLLVYADYLQSRGDPRGELVVLDAHARAGESLDREALDRLLVLAAEHGFPPFDTDADLLAFRETNGYAARIGDRHIHVSQQPENKVGLAEPGTAAFIRMDRESDGPWSPEETNVILSIVLAAMHSGTPAADVRFPDRFAIRSHPRFRAGPWPTYAFPYEFRVPLMNAGWRLRARDRDRWLSLWNARG